MWKCFILADLTDNGVCDNLLPPRRTQSLLDYSIIVCVLLESNDDLIFEGKDGSLEKLNINFEPLLRISSSLEV